MTRYPIAKALDLVQRLNDPLDDCGRWQVANVAPFRDLGDYAAVAYVEVLEDGTEITLGHWDSVAGAVPVT